MVDSIENGAPKKKGGRRPGAGRKPKAQKPANLSITEVVDKVNRKLGEAYWERLALKRPDLWVKVVARRVVQQTEVSGPAGGAITVILSPV